MISFIRIVRFALFALFLLEILTWNPSEEGGTIVQKFLLMTGLETSTGWFYTATVAMIFSISFPEIWGLIRNFIEDNISRRLVKKYVSFKNKYITLILFLGIIIIVFIWYLVNQSIEVDQSLFEFIGSLKRSKSFLTTLYCLVPITTIIIWVNNRFTLLNETSKDELVVAYSIKPNAPSYLISGQMSVFELDKLLGNDKNDYTIKVIRDFPEPITVSLNLGNIETNFTLQVKLGASVSQQIHLEDAKWIDKTFSDINKKQDSSLVKILTDFSEQTISQAKLDVTALISEKVDNTSDLQVNYLLMKRYLEFVDGIEKMLSERIRMVTNSNIQVIEVEIPTKKMVPNNIDKRIQEDHKSAQSQYQSITTSSIGEKSLDDNSFSSLRKAEEILGSKKRQKLFNLSPDDINNLVKATNTVFETSKVNFEKKYLLSSKKKEETQNNDEDFIIDIG
ncbi:hypothetical protein KORDIASMS9_02829 [Kordia sp. SMS9]|uniref:hypothetical protein n=1 Tax=Kordia sp. SMS9 TaxID=2282170 RepID=UPI000E0DFDDD|nr:hypothetical protein [Kordia sp. SMS9]AXG70589.1 hypothetical protein KORDIASMS9_02829 [Kordia sp. SMS9]